MENKEKIIEFCKNNRTSQRELMELFGFKHRQAVSKFLKDNNVQMNTLTEEERRNKISEARKNNKLKEWSKYNIDEIKAFCNNNNTTDRELVTVFGFPGRQSARDFLEYNNIILNKYNQKEINDKIRESHSKFTPDEKLSISEKRKKTMLDRHGVEYSFQSKEIKEKMMVNNIKKYGHENPFQIEEFKNKIKTTNNKKYGVDYPSQSREIKEKMIKTLSNNDYRSSGEIELNNWINSLGFDTCKKYINKISKSKSYAGGYEIDIFIPSKNTGIEFNGEYWHSDKVIKDKSYHYNKSISSEKNGIRLIHVFESYWSQPNKRAIYESIIRNALGAPIRKIRASKCELRIITTKEAEEFFNANHLGGYVPCKLSYGLFYNGELVQAELFSKARFTKKIEWESVRGCSKLGCMVYGGYEKVLKHFKEEYEPKSIISYVDFNVFIGALHEHAGFKFKNYTGPDHWYLNSDNQLKRYWIVRGNKEVDIQWAKDRDSDIKYHYWFAGSKVYIWEKD